MAHLIVSRWTSALRGTMLSLIKRASLKSLNLAVISNCIQYEKAAVLFNAGAIYSQLGNAQSLRSVEGKRQAALYFQAC